MAMKYQAYGEFDDLMQEGYLGLCQAVDGYDPDAGASFIHYAAYWIRRAMLFISAATLRSGSQSTCTPRSAGMSSCGQRFFLSLAESRITAKLDRIWGVSDKSVAGLKKAARMRQIASLDTLSGTRTGTDRRGYGAGSGRSGGAALDTVQQEQLKATLWGYGK